jgi:hypothetical protein
MIIKHRVRCTGSAGVYFAAAIVLLSAVAAEAQSWAPPLGIPRPSFGTSEVARAVPNPWTSETPGFYYVNNQHASATDSATYGTPSRPRLTIPTSVPAGSVVEVRGGPYMHAADISWTGSGTASSPVFYRGVGKPKIQTSGTTYRRVNIRGPYVVVEGFDFINSPPQIVGSFVVLRDNEVRDRQPAPGGAGIYAGNSQDSVILRNHIHNNGDPNYHEENDIHGVQVSSGAQRVWIVDNHMHHNGGDSVQVNSGSGTLARLIYIGRNEMHDEGENAVDIKQAEDIIISENNAYNFDPTQYPTSGSDGTAIVVNDDNAANGLNNRIWVIFNNLHDSRHGIRTQSYAYVIGNVIHDVQGNGITSFGSHDVLIEHNTFYNVEHALDRSGGSSGNKIEFYNNLIMNSRGTAVAVSGSGAAQSRISHTLFQSPARIAWGGTTYSSLTAFRNAQSSQCQGCKEGNPLLADPVNDVYTLLAGSPALDSGSPSGIYGSYQQRYNVSIAMDVLGRPRPSGGVWDIGAYEGVGGGSGGPVSQLPSAPTNLRILQ